MENEILELNKPKEENCKDSKLFENQNLEKLLEIWILGRSFLKSMMQERSNDK